MWQPREEQEELPNEPEVVEVNGKLMLLDQRYPSSTRGIVKTLEIVSLSWYGPRKQKTERQKDKEIERQTERLRDRERSEFRIVI